MHRILRNHVEEPIMKAKAIVAALALSVSLPVFSAQRVPSEAGGMNQAATDLLAECLSNLRDQPLAYRGIMMISCSVPRWKGDGAIIQVEAETSRGGRTRYTFGKVGTGGTVFLSAEVIL